MDISLDQFGGCGEPAQADPVVLSPRLDWHGLSARLAAAHTARVILAAPPATGAPSSFAPGVAHELAAWRAVASRSSGAPSSPGVNLNAKADGKPAGTIERNQAGEDRPIVRGRL